MNGRQLKLAGMERVGNVNALWLRAMRDYLRARALAGPVTAEDAHELAQRLNWEPTHPNAYGCLFRSGWRRVGFRPARRPAAHARLVAMWEVADGQA